MAVRLPLLDAPLDRDEGSLACFALGLLEGRLPYRDFADIKPPLLYLAYLPMALAGLLAPILFKLTGFLWNALSVILIWRLATRFAGEKTALLVALIFAVYTADPSAVGFTITPELLSHLPVIGALLLFHSTLRKPVPGRALLAGCLLGIAICMKQQVLPLLLLFIMAPLYRRSLRISFEFLLGALLTGLVCAGVLAISGLLWTALDSASWGAVNIIAALPASGIPHSLSSIFGGAITTQTALWLLALIGLSDRKIPLRDRLFIGIWFLCAVAGIAMGRRPYPYYLQLALPPLAISGGIGLARLIRGPASAVISMARVCVAGAVLFSLFRVFPLITVTREVRAWALHPDNHFLEAEKVADWLRDNGPRTAPIFVAGSELEIAYLAGLKFAGRCPLPYLLTIKSPDSGKIRDEWLKGVEADAPGVAVYCRSMKAWGDVYSDLETTNKLRKAAKDYLEGPDWTLVNSIPPFDIYIRRP